MLYLVSDHSSIPDRTDVASRRRHRVGPLSLMSQRKGNMDALRYSPTIKRLIRQDPPEQLGRPTRLFLERPYARGASTMPGSGLTTWRSRSAAFTTCSAPGAGTWCATTSTVSARRPGPTLARESMAPWLGTTGGLPGEPVATVIGEGSNAQLRAGRAAVAGASDGRRQALPGDPGRRRPSRRRAERRPGSNSTRPSRRVISRPSPASSTPGGVRIASSTTSCPTGCGR